MPLTAAERLKAVRAQLRSYASLDDSGVDQDDQDEAQGLAMTAQNLAATHSDDEMDDMTDALHGGLGEIHGDNDGDEKRSYADNAGKVLRPSQKNPRVRRWIKLAAVKHVAHTFGDTHAKMGNFENDKVNEAVNALHHANRREIGLSDNGQEMEKQSALHSSHYHENHGDFVKSSAKKYGVGENAVAYSLAYHARAELAKQRNALEPMKNGKPQPLRNKDITDKDFHKNLGGRAKSAFIKGMIARHGQ
jgi:hypothetical protein